jgi:predicted phosphodiesterase
MPDVHGDDYFIYGNHDDALICEKSPKFLGDFGIKQIDGRKVFFLSGAMSTDKQYRIEGKSWWAYEELTYVQLCDAAELYRREKPEIVITHDCPLTPRKEMFGYRDAGRTVQALESMFADHQPEHWVFGHHHLNRAAQICGTRFVCVPELCTYIIN